ncbi:MAG: hypothetical protein J7J52_01195 [Deltaproteobacteria bacterium]|nr:hypothetical protein [Deltaproteobacteria bacterium]
MTKNTLEAGELSIQTHSSQPRVLPPSPASFLLSECKHYGAGTGFFSTPRHGHDKFPCPTFHFTTHWEIRDSFSFCEFSILLSPTLMVTEVKNE